ncbi:MAG: ABC transporter permease, partial [Eubacterium sp.]|nr:ABC transporter permease [Eubacterium sp.]
MRFLLTYLKPYLKEVVLAPLFKLGEATLELFVPLVMTAIIDRGIADHEPSFILWMGAVLVGLATVGMIISITAQFFSAKAAVGFTTDVKHALFSHITHLSRTSVDRIGTSTLITRMTSDINQVGTGVNLFLRLFLRSPFIVFGAMVMAFTIDVRCALIFTVVIPMLAVIVAVCLRLTIPLYKNVQMRVDRVLTHTRENLSGVRVIRAFRRQETERRTFEDEADGVYREQKRVGRIASLMNPLTLLVVNLGILVLIRVGGLRVEFGGLTQGQVVALVNYMSQILVELVKLANLILNVNRALACAGRIHEVFELP